MFSIHQYFAVAVQRLKATRPECIRQHFSLKLPLAKTQIPTCMASSFKLANHEAQTEEDRDREVGKYLNRSLFNVEKQ